MTGFKTLPYGLIIRPTFQTFCLPRPDFQPFNFLHNKREIMTRNPPKLLRQVLQFEHDIQVVVDHPKNKVTVYKDGESLREWQFKKVWEIIDESWALYYLFEAIEK